MPSKSMKALEDAVSNHLQDDDSSSITVIARKNGPDMAMIRADVLEVLKEKAAKFDAQSVGDEEYEEDAFTLLVKD